MRKEYDTTMYIILILKAESQLIIMNTLTNIMKDDIKDGRVTYFGNRLTVTE